MRPFKHCLHKKRSTYWRAQTEEVIEANPVRVPYFCSAAEAGAGCCDYAFVNHEDLLQLKTTLFAEIFRHHIDYSDLPAVESLSVLHSSYRSHSSSGKSHPAGQGSRIRAKCAITSDGKIGLYKYRSKEIITGLACQAFHPSIAKIVENNDNLCSELSRKLSYRASAWHPHQDKIFPRSSSISRNKKNPYRQRADTDRNTVGDMSANEVYFLYDHKEKCHINLLASGRVTPITPVWDAYFKISNVDFILPPTAFWQPHYMAAQCYSNLLLHWLEQYSTPLCSVWDLYSGAGVFARTVRTLSRAKHIIAVDSAPHIQYVSEASHGVTGIFQSVENFLSSYLNTSYLKVSQRKEIYHPDVIIADPPRKGLTKKNIENIIAIRPGTIVLFGCELPAFSRDIALLISDYKLVEIKVFDAFPGTDHMECIALLHHR